MTLRQKMLLKELPNNNYNIAKTAVKVGYSKSYAYHDIHKNLVSPCSKVREYFTEATVKRDIKKIKKLTLKAKDYTNALRATELETKILGMITEKTQDVPVNKDDNQFSLDRLSRIKIAEDKTKPATEN